MIFYEDIAQPILKTGDYLGCLTDEIAEMGDGAYVRAMVSLGPKTYSLEIIVPGKPEPIYVTKMKGISLKYNNKHLTDFKTMKSLVDGDLNGVSVELVNNITRGPDFRIFTRASSEKCVRLVYNKRARLGAYDTRPWGYREDLPPVIADPNIIIEDWTVRTYV